MDKRGLDYRQAGVNIDKGNQLVQRIKSVAAATHNSAVLSGLGGFGGLYELPINQYTNPVLVSGTDGVGTKLKLAIQTGNHSGIGADLVAMCANDLIVSGAKPLYFLDYFATGQLDLVCAETVIASIAKACKQASMALIGGETAEMPGMYGEGDYDLAGFAVGIVEKEAIITGNRVVPGDSLLALASSGAHANGYSLIRKIMEVNHWDLNQIVQGQSLIEHLLTPTRIYVQAVQTLLETIDVKALAHITGGGISENLPRVLPHHCRAIVDTSSWQWPELFSFLQQQGKVESNEMWRTFNCGVGMVAVINSDSATLAQEKLAAIGIESWCMGEVEQGEDAEASVVYR